MISVKRAPDIVAALLKVLLLGTVLMLSGYAPPSRAQAGFTDTTDNLDVIIRRFGVACPDETDLGEAADPSKPRSTVFGGRPCPFEKRLAGKLSKMSEREPLQGYLERNEFQCSRTKIHVSCFRELIYVFSPILFGRRMNPDIHNRFITYVNFTQSDEQYIPAQDIRVNFTRFTHQDKPDDPAIGSETRSIYPSR